MKEFIISTSLKSQSLKNSNKLA